jgi:hypothetical protein
MLATSRFIIGHEFAGSYGYNRYRYTKKSEHMNSFFYIFKVHFFEQPQAPSSLSLMLSDEVHPVFENIS